MEKDYNQVGFRIRKLNHMMARIMESNVTAEGIDKITLMHGWIIRYLYEHRKENIFQKDIEKYFSIGRSTVTNIIQLMEKKGYIRRESVEVDARLKKVILTEKGVASHERIEELITEMNFRMVEGISEEEIDIFLKVAAHIEANIENVRNKIKNKEAESF